MHQVRDYDSFEYFALHLHPSASPVNVAQSIGVILEGPVDGIDDHYIFSIPKHQVKHVEEALNEAGRRRKLLHRGDSSSSATRRRN